LDGETGKAMALLRQLLLFPSPIVEFMFANYHCFCSRITESPFKIVAYAIAIRIFDAFKTAKWLLV
jgi:hypothetical protein